MKRIIIFSISSILLLGAAGLLGGFISENSLNKKFKKSVKAELQFGDIVFQSSTSGQSLAIQLATSSEYSHVGMVYGFEKGDWQIIEAVQPVRITPLNVWKKGGDTDDYAVRRITADSLLTADVEKEMKELGKSWLGKDYDIFFDWSDEELYCSELVWKLYEETLGLELGELRPLKDFDLDHPVVKEIMKKRYGDKIPWESKMISPGDMFNSSLLEDVDLP